MTIAGKILRGIGKVVGGGLKAVAPLVGSVTGGVGGKVVGAIGNLIAPPKKVSQIATKVLPAGKPVSGEVIRSRGGGFGGMLAKERARVTAMTRKVTPSPASIMAPNYDDFAKPLTGAQQSVFGAAPSDSYNEPVKVGYTSPGLDNFNASSGDVSISTNGKKLPEWLWPVVGFGLAVVTIIISLFSRKRR